MALDKAKIDSLTYEELEAIRESCCDGCKNAFWFHDSNCRNYCKGFEEAVKEMQDGP